MQWKNAKYMMMMMMMMKIVLKIKKGHISVQRPEVDLGTGFDRNLNSKPESQYYAYFTHVQDCVFFVSSA